MRPTLLLSAILMSTVLAFAQTPKPLSAFDQELVNNEKQFVQALQDKNAAYVDRTVSEDFKGIGVNGEFYDKGEVVGAAQEGMPKDLRVYDVRIVRIDDGCAVVAYNTIIPGARPRYRHMSDTWTKEGGQWKLKFQQTTPNLWSATDLD
jgi:hypothetical protein